MERRGFGVPKRGVGGEEPKEGPSSEIIQPDLWRRDQAVFLKPDYALILFEKLLKVQIPQGS